MGGFPWQRRAGHRGHHHPDGQGGRLGSRGEAQSHRGPRPGLGFGHLLHRREGGGPELDGAAGAARAAGGLERGGGPGEVPGDPVRLHGHCGLCHRVLGAGREVLPLQGTLELYRRGDHRPAEQARRRSGRSAGGLQPRRWRLDPLQSPGRPGVHERERAGLPLRPGGVRRHGSGGPVCHHPGAGAAGGLPGPLGEEVPPRHCPGGRRHLRRVPEAGGLPLHRLPEERACGGQEQPQSLPALPDARGDAERKSPVPHRHGSGERVLGGVEGVDRERQRRSAGPGEHGRRLGRSAPVGSAPHRRGAAAGTQDAPGRALQGGEVLCPHRAVHRYCRRAVLDGLPLRPGAGAVRQPGAGPGQLPAPVPGRV